MVEKKKGLKRHGGEINQFAHNAAMYKSSDWHIVIENPRVGMKKGINLTHDDRSDDLDKTNQATLELNAFEVCGLLRFGSSYLYPKGE